MKSTDGVPELLQKFDANPKVSKWILAVVVLVIILLLPCNLRWSRICCCRSDPEHGEGHGGIDPSKRGDVSPELAIDDQTGEEIEHQRLQAVIEEDGQVA